MKAALFPNLESEKEFFFDELASENCASATLTNTKK